MEVNNTKGFFYADDHGIPYAEFIADGLKTLETRRRDMLGDLVGERVAPKLRPVTESEVEKLRKAAILLDFSARRAYNIDGADDPGTEERTMKRYEIMRARFEFDYPVKSRSKLPEYTADEIFDEVMQKCYESDRLAGFDNEINAREMFAAYRNNTTHAERTWTGWAIIGTCSWIEENECDEDGEIVQTLSVLDYDAEPFTQPEDEE